MSFRGLKTLGVFATLALASSYGQMMTQMRVTIPFDFTVGKAVLPAGVYEIQKQGAFQNQFLFTHAGGPGTFVAGYSVERSSATEQATVVFNRYGGTYFLQSIWPGDDALGMGIVKSKTESEFAKTASVRRPEQVTLIASR
jgi:hypothetical protein